MNRLAASLATTLLGALACAAQAHAAAAADRDVDALAAMSLEELARVEVTTASRFAEPLSEVASAAYVITRDQIRRSGVTSIPEALRLAPGVQVARTGAFGWAITIRGFNGDLSNKLLVLVDGRSVYSPLYAGVFWDAQDTLLEDVERIEVIAGPGGTLWGANAVNGIVNIITRPAADTRGGFAQVGGGANERAMAGVRQGWTVGERAHARAYVKFVDRRDYRQIGPDLFDDGRMLQAGGRLDAQVGGGSVTWQGDAYRGERTTFIDRDFTLGTRPRGAVEVDTVIRGANMLGRWRRASASGSDLTVQLYVDHTEREIPFTFTEKRTTTDLDLQQRIQLGSRHELLWGAGVRASADSLGNSTFAAFNPPRRTTWTTSGFVQDRIALSPGRLNLTVGSKLEHNAYTGFEAQPNVLLAFLPSPRQTWWAAVSRAVRIPARLDADLQVTVPLSIPTVPVPIYARVTGSDDFQAERLLAREAGWRWQPTARLSLDVAAFYNEYRGLQTQEPRTPIVVAGPPAYILLPNELVNGKRARSAGGTLVAAWRPVDRWRLRLDYTNFALHVRREPFSQDPTARNAEGDAPRHQAGLQSELDLPRGVSLFVAARYVGALPNQRIAAYTTVDANLLWRPNARLELALTGRGLLDPRHSEFGAPRTDALPRTVYGSVSWRF